MLRACVSAEALIEDRESPNRMPRVEEIDSLSILNGMEMTVSRFSRRVLEKEASGLK